MNLLELIDWTKSAQNLKTLRERVSKESDINVCLSLLGEIRHRAGLAIDHAKKSARYEKDIEEYLATLAKRGVTVPAPDLELSVGGMTEPVPNIKVPAHDPNPSSGVIGAKEQPKTGFWKK